MFGNNGRRGVNVSQYIANLNTVNPPEDNLESPPNFDQDLALFTNTEFIDWDAGVDNFEQQQSTPPLDVNFDPPTNTTATADASEPKMDFQLNSRSFVYCISPHLSTPFHFVVSALHCPGHVAQARSRPIGVCPGYMHTPPNRLHCTIASHGHWPFTARSTRAARCLLARPQSASGSSWALPPLCLPRLPGSQKHAIGRHVLLTLHTSSRTAQPSL